jgi:hypothetical protein
MDFLPTIEQLAQKSATQFANWNPSLFQDYCQALLRDHAKSPLSSPLVATALAEMLCEGIGRGYLTTSLHAHPANLMEYCFRNWLVSRLADVAAERKLHFLADAWNLLEGVLREPSWVNAYVMARVRELHGEHCLESFLGVVLKPLFEPATMANWTGPFRVIMLSLRACDDEILPGDMHLVAPTILAIRDRRRDLACGVVLRKQGQSELAGIFGETSPFVEQPSITAPSWQAEWVTFGKERIQLPFLGEPFRWLQVRAGFVVASAVNSQKLWIVESAT